MNHVFYYEMKSTAWMDWQLQLLQCFVHHHQDLRGSRRRDVNVRRHSGDIDVAMSTWRRQRGYVDDFEIGS